jgi:deacetoxycephalosporin-C synthase/deacetoxycephalosporin-C hydroxylase
MSVSDVPTFSLPELRRGARQEELRHCLEHVGAFYLTDFGISDADHGTMVRSTLDFFNQASDDEKRAVTNTNPAIRRGYSRLEKESTARITNTGDYTDYSMAYSAGLSDNLYPSEEFSKTFSGYFDAAYRIAQDAGKAVLQAAGVELEEGLDAFLECDPLLRFRYFPDVPRERCADHTPARMAPHYDISVITLIHQTPCANGFVSLQCETQGGYVDLPHKPEAMIVMCGAVATLLSNGKLRASRHQITSPPETLRVGSSRTSSVFFLRPKSDFTFSVRQAKACGLDVIVTGETATFKDWIGGNYVEMRTVD